jgi:hypothetical protein
MSLLSPGGRDQEPSGREGSGFRFSRGNNGGGSGAAQSGIYTAGDTAALVQLHNSTVAKARALVKAIIRNPADAAEVTGDVSGDHVMRSDDWHVARSGSTHEDFWSKTGSLLFIRAEMGSRATP